VFVGTYPLYIDRGRIFVPKEILEEMKAPHIILFLDPDNQQLMFYDKMSLDELEKGLPLDPKQLSGHMSILLANGQKTVIDKKRRIVIPKAHLDGANLKTRCLLIGQGRFCILKGDDSRDT
jgi:DNA-binding transcriptional regulator/RsmH inhibitor MraZ